MTGGAAAHARRWFDLGGVRARVTLVVLAVAACLYSLLASAGFLFVAHAGHAAIESRVESVLQELALRMQSGEPVARLSTADGVSAYVVVAGTELPAPAAGVLRWTLPADVDGTSALLVGEAAETRWFGDLHALHRITWLGVGAAAVLTALLAGAATGRALRPVRRTIDLLDALGPHDTTSRVPVVGTGDEIERLGATVNAMLDRIAAAHDAQRRFTSDAAHELRTPLMALAGELELAAMGVSAVPGGADAATLARLRLQCDRLGARVDDLVLLSTLDEAPPLVTSVVDLGELVRREAAALFADEESPTLEVHGAAVMVAGDPALLERAVRNLLANARRHAAKRVVATVERHAAVTEVGPGPAGDGWAWVHVDDDGPGIPAERRTLVFERFARLDDGRVADRGGSGLGLAIVASVAARHGGRVTAGDGPLGGARLTLELPAGGEGWAVRYLVDHAVDVQVRSGNTFLGYALPPEVDRSTDAGRIAAWRAVAAWFDGAVTGDDRLGVLTTHPLLGETPRANVLAVAINDLAVHTGDLSSALGMDVTLPDEVVTGAAAVPVDRATSRTDREVRARS